MTHYCNVANTNEGIVRTHCQADKQLPHGVFGENEDHTRQSVLEY